MSGWKKNSSLQVMQRHGPCWQQKHDKAEPNESHPHIDILSEDEARVNSIHSMLPRRFSHENMKQPDSANIPVRSGLPIRAGGYIVSISLGSPETEWSFIFDTGSDFTWTRCKPYLVESHYDQQEPIFDPSKSTTYSHIKCPSSMCAWILSTGKYQECANYTKTCIYKLKYAEASFSGGFLSKERLTTAAGGTFDNFLFGCSPNKGGNTLGGAAGILGLSRHPISFVQQTTNTYNKVFSYCLPSTPSSMGHLTFGSNDVPNNVQYTPITTIPNLTSFYGINVIGITVGGAELSSVTSTLSSAKAIIDVGTTITRLPQSVYAALRSEFQKKMAIYPMACELVMLDTCYDLSGYETVMIPEINLVFGGGVKLNLDASGIVYAASEKQVCLAFAPNTNDEDVVILGNVQQKTIEVVYDLNVERLGFGPPGGCI
ncbi:aspartyl protease family protein At5g10770-like [Neltuma alba]|uniref:aspartyl protease family protein At5g10770-like n=1 Tax=Neltuma alba TaxID=207710 RepID=UPI0010A345CF|nr:aspartyl protease family protein At5g10770-like [Prosopis alba]